MVLSVPCWASLLRFGIDARHVPGPWALLAFFLTPMVLPARLLAVALYGFFLRIG